MDRKALREAPYDIRDRAFADMREYCSDDDADRLHIYDSPVLRYLIFTTVGTPVSPYLAPDIARALDFTIRQLLPTRRWPQPFDAIRVTTDIVQGTMNGPPVLRSTALFFNSSSAEPEQKRIDGKPGEEIENTMKAQLFRRPSGIVHVQFHPLAPIARF